MFKFPCIWSCLPIYFRFSGQWVIHLSILGKRISSKPSNNVLSSNETSSGSTLNTKTNKSRVVPRDQENQRYNVTYRPPNPCFYTYRKDLGDNTRRCVCIRMHSLFIQLVKLSLKFCPTLSSTFSDEGPLGTDGEYKIVSLGSLLVSLPLPSLVSRLRSVGEETHGDPHHKTSPVSKEDVESGGRVKDNVTGPN